MARDSDATTPSKTEVITSVTAELIFAANLVASSESARPGVPAGWASAQRDLLPAPALAALGRLKGFWWPTMGTVDFLCLEGNFNNPLSFLDRIAAYPIDRFLAVLLNGDVTPEKASALVADPTSIPDVMPGLSRFSQGTAAALTALFTDPEGHRQALLTLIGASDTPLFRQTFDRFQVESQETIKTIERRLHSEDPLSVAESLRQKPLNHGPASFERYTFVPSRLIGHHHVQSWGNGATVFFLQEGATDLTSPTPTGAALADFLKVLGDKTRMDILRLLCCQPSYGKEIAASLGLTTATVSRHLDQLKAAGLVREEKADANNVKTIRYAPEILDAQIELLKTYLLHS